MNILNAILAQQMRRQEQPESEAPWQTDEHGRKYRIVAPGHIEHMPTITIDGIEIENTPESIKAFNARRKAARLREGG